MLLLVSVAALPQLLFATRRPTGGLRNFFAHAPGGFWPWTAVSNIALGSAVLLPILILTVLGAAALSSAPGSSSAACVTTRMTPSAHAGTNTRPLSRVESLLPPPIVLLPDPLAAVVEKELRALSRTPRFRMVFIMGFSFGLLVWLPITLGRATTIRSWPIITSPSSVSMPSLSSAKFLISILSGSIVPPPSYTFPCPYRSANPL